MMGKIGVLAIAAGLAGALGCGEDSADVEMEATEQKASRLTRGICGSACYGRCEIVELACFDDCAAKPPQATAETDQEEDEQELFKQWVKLFESCVACERNYSKCADKCRPCDDGDKVVPCKNNRDCGPEAKCSQGICFAT